MLGIDSPPVATINDCACTPPWLVWTSKPSLPRWTDSTSHWVRICAPAASHSSSSMRTICLEEMSQNNWPSSFS